MAHCLWMSYALKIYLSAMKDHYPVEDDINEPWHVISNNVVFWQV